MRLEDKKILITGSHGFLGSFVYEEFLSRGIKEENIARPRSFEYDLRFRENCREVVEDRDIVIHLAANVGGIGYNKKHPGDVFYDNATMNINMMEEARKAGVEKYVAIGTVCSYPKEISAPFQEEDIWEGYPEETNAPYGIAKRLQIVQSKAYRDQHGFNGINLILENLYGPRDNFDPEESHVIPALMRKMHEAKRKNKDNVVVWGTGKPTREFLYVRDAAEAIVEATEKREKADPVNIGSGEEVSIKELVNYLIEVTGFSGDIKYDTTKPDGQPRRKFDVSKAKEEFGFEAKTSLKEGLKKTYEWYKNNKDD
ncbi:MAG: GDP-L-fucose synthase family protein [Candidatus Nanohaloarchaea archaeon]